MLFWASKACMHLLVSAGGRAPCEPASLTQSCHYGLCSLRVIYPSSIHDMCSPRDGNFAGKEHRCVARLLTRSRGKPLSPEPKCSYLGDTRAWTLLQDILIQTSCHKSRRVLHATTTAGKHTFPACCLMLTLSNLVVEYILHRLSQISRSVQLQHVAVRKGTSIQRSNPIQDEATQFSCVLTLMQCSGLPCLLARKNMQQFPKHGSPDAVIISI